MNICTVFIVILLASIVLWLVTPTKFMFSSLMLCVCVSEEREREREREPLAGSASVPPVHLKLATEAHK
jgi:hypothetical protein